MSFPLVNVEIQTISFYLLYLISEEYFPFVFLKPDYRFSTNLLLRELFSNDDLVDGLSSFGHAFLDSHDAVTLHVTGAHQHTLQGTQPEVVVRLWRQLLITQPEKGYIHKQIVLDEHWDAKTI